MSKSLKIKVKVALALRDKKQKWLAKEIGINEGQLSDVLNGKRNGKRTDFYVKEIKNLLGIIDSE
ncbi:transcriptional regulator [Latilactobacillus sakei]|uniref:transcriptional regulator n=1 Tax=Latilactobacillus sakei TaxID=1599 RepID=UPI0020C7B6D5|nr:transcriptional regulator [Latilactobacillus sakei]MCP8855964.1 transcriptional regulator [Latilactobacillus sakei]